MTTIADLDLALSVSDMPVDDLVAVARTADRLGFGCFWLAEGIGPDIFSLLTRLALSTQRIELGTGIVNVFSRTPTTLALAADTVLVALGDRRLHLGVGASGKGLIEKFHGVPHHRPVARVRDAVRIVDAVFKEGRLPDGVDTLESEAGLPVPVSSPRDRLRLFVASLGPKSVEVTGEVADGWLPIWLSATHGSERLDLLEAAARRAGRPRPEVAAYLYAVVSDDPDIVVHVRATLAWYVAANGTAYARLFRDYGYVDEVDAIVSHWSSGDRTAARRAVTDEMLHDCTVTGDPGDVVAALRRFRAAGIDRPVLRFPRQLDAGNVIPMLERLATTLGQESP